MVYYTARDNDCISSRFFFDFFEFHTAYYRKVTAVLHFLKRIRFYIIKLEVFLFTNPCIYRFQIMNIIIHGDFLFALLGYFKRKKYYGL